MTPEQRLTDAMALLVLTGRSAAGLNNLAEAHAAWRASLPSAAPAEPPYTGHASDCATHNEPAYPNGPCDCHLAQPELDAAPARAEGAWPDVTRPGVPLNPERDGWHWLLSKEGGKAWIAHWTERGRYSCWDHPYTSHTVYPGEMVIFNGYAGPVAPPGTPDALRRAWHSARDAAEAACRAVQVDGKFGCERWIGGICADRVAALVMPEGA